MDRLAYDLTLYLHEPGTSAVLVRIVDRTPRPSPPGSDQGVIRCRVEAVIQGRGIRTGQILSVGYGRKLDPLARAKSSVNHWNALSLTPGDLLVLVGKPAADNLSWQAQSGNQVASADDPAVVGLRECCRIKELANKSGQHQALRAGLIGANPLVRRYAIEAICRQEVVPRQTGCDIIIQALNSGELDDEGRLRFADSLASLPVFDEELADDPVNRKAVAALAAAAAQLKNPDHQATIVRYLGSCIFQDFAENPTENRRVRQALLQAIGKAPPPPIADTLARLANSDDADDRETANGLTAAWTSSGA